MIRFGLQLPSFSFPDVPNERLFDRITDIAVAAEDSGFDSFFVMDHFQQIPFVGRFEEPMLEGYTLLGAVAARTSRIKLGTLVTGVVYRNPALLAKVVTTLDVVSGGRAILGIGAAWNEKEATEYGYDWPSTRERMDRLSVREALNFPRPVQPGGPKIMIGGSGERRTLRLVARYADACNFFGDVDTIRHKVSVLADHCRDEGRDPAEITKTRLGVLIVAATKEEAQAKLERATKRGAEERPAASYTMGDPEAVCDQVQAFFDAGLDGVIFNMPPGSPPEDVALAGKTFTDRFALAR